MNTFMERPNIREKLFRSYTHQYPDEYNKIIRQLKEYVKNVNPNDAHITLTDCHIPIITMNIDDLHYLVGCKPIELHGNL